MLYFGLKPKETEPLTKEKVIENLSSWVSDFKLNKSLRKVQLQGLLDHITQNKVTLEEIGLSEEAFDEIKLALEKEVKRGEKIKEIQNLFRDLYIESDKFFLSKDKEKIRALCQKIKDKMDENGIKLSDIQTIPKALKVFNEAISS